MEQKTLSSLSELKILFPDMRFRIATDFLLSNVSSLKDATSSDISFFGSEKYREDYEKTFAGLICVLPCETLLLHQNYVITDDPSATFIEFTSFFNKGKSSSYFDEKVSPLSVCAPDVKIGKNVTIYPHVVIDSNVIIGDRVVIYPNTYIGCGTVIGNDTTIYSNVTIREKIVVGNRVIIQAGAVIGSCGFGYYTTKQKKHLKIKQVGSVVLEDDVEVGANTTIDRARIAKTIIGQGTKIDNLVQIGHNVKLGKNCLIVAQVGISGSTELGDRVTIAGQVGFVGHINIVDDVTVTVKSMVTKSIRKSGIYGGLFNVMPFHKFLKVQVYQNNIASLSGRIKNLERFLT